MYKEYGELSTMLYEHTKPVGFSINGDIEYYKEKLENVSGKVLEAGVGTGRILIPLIKNGITIDGVDVSKEMLTQCKTNLKKHNVTAELYEQDLTRLSLPYKYDAIIMPTGSFGLLPREHIQEVLNLFHHHLNTGGKIIIDLEMPSYFKEDLVSTNSFRLNKDTGMLLTCINGKIDWIAQKTSSIYKYEFIEKGEITKTEISNFTLYWYGIVELEMRLKLAGFNNFVYETGYGTDKTDILTFTAFK